MPSIRAKLTALEGPGHRGPGHQGAWRLADATVPTGMIAEIPQGAAGTARDGTCRVTVDIGADGRIAAIHAAGAAPETQMPVIDAGGVHVWSRMADLHTHLDKSQTWARAPNDDGSFTGAKQAAKGDRRVPWSYEDVHARMDFALKSALAHGTRAIRTHLDSQKGRTEPSWEAMADLRAAWKGRIAIEPSSSMGAAKFMGDYGEEIAALTARHGGVLGPVLYHGPQAQAEISRVFDLAEKHDLTVDFHTDENLDPASDGLRLIAKETIRRGWQGRVTCGHCCSLSLKPLAEAQAIAARVAEAGITVVALPMTNIYLLGRREAATPVYRGIAPIHLLRAEGVAVAFGSDNCRDAFHPYGDHDLVEVFRESARIGHADMSWGPWADAVAAIPEAAMGLGPDTRLAPGAPADFVIFEGRSFSEVFARLGARRALIVNGRPLSEEEATPPPFSALDGLEGLGPEG